VGCVVVQRKLYIYHWSLATGAVGFAAALLARDALRFAARFGLVPRRRSRSPRSPRAVRRERQAVALVAHRRASSRRATPSARVARGVHRRYDNVPVRRKFSELDAVGAWIATHTSHHQRNAAAVVQTATPADAARQIQPRHSQWSGSGTG